MVTLLQTGLLADAAASRDLDMDVVVHQAVDSTNTWSMQQCKAGRNLPFACFAESQTSGRGRRGKQWVMSPNSNIAMSLSWSFVRSHMQLHLLPLSIAMAIVATLEHIGLRHVQVKWPNDVFVQERKIAGILIETQPLNDKEIAVVIGVGLNYKMPENKIMSERGGSEIFSEITDIEREISMQAAGQKTDRTNVAVLLLQNIIDVLQVYQSGPGRYLEKFRTQYDYCKDKSVEIILDNQEVLTGFAQGVNDDAELLVLIDGELQVFNSAEVSVKA